jgi:hypothetical protein
MPVAGPARCTVPGGSICRPVGLPGGNSEEEYSKSGHIFEFDENRLRKSIEKDFPGLSIFSFLGSLFWAGSHQARVHSDMENNAPSASWNEGNKGSLLFPVDLRRGTFTPEVWKNYHGCAVGMTRAQVDLEVLEQFRNNSASAAAAQIGDSIGTSIKHIRHEDYACPRAYIFKKVHPATIGLELDGRVREDLQFNTWLDTCTTEVPGEKTNLRWNLCGEGEESLVEPDAWRRPLRNWWLGAGLILPRSKAGKIEVLVMIPEQALTTLKTSRTINQWSPIIED